MTQPTSEGARRARLDGGRVRVMIVDDHPMVREGLRLFLSEAEELDVVGEAGDGEAALALAQRLQPDVILMDLLMPKLDGVEVTRRLREVGNASRVVILTSVMDESRVRDAVLAGAIGFLFKDVGRDQLLGAIHSAARGLPTLHPIAQRELLREVTAPAPPASPLDALTNRERDVLRLVARGESNKRIAAQLDLSIGTVKGYLSQIFEKLGVSDRTSAALLAAKHGLDEAG